MESPIEKYIQWYQALSASHQEEIASFAGHTIPGFTEIDFLAEGLPGKYIDGVRRIGSDPHKGVGMMLCIRANFDFFFSRTRATAEDWEVTRERIERAKQYAIDTDKKTMIGSAEKMLDGLPERRDAWIATCASWKALCERELSDEALDRYFSSSVTTTSSS